MWEGWKTTNAKTDDQPKYAKKDQSRIEKKKLLIQNLLEKLKEDLPSIYFGEKSEFVRDSEISAFIDQFKGLNGYDFKIISNFFSQGIKKGNERGVWSLGVPPLVQVIRREKNPYQPSQFAHIGQIRNIKLLFAGSLCVNRMPDFSADERVGQIYLSAILNGGLLNKKYLDCLCIRRSRIVNFDNKFWIDLDVKKKGANGYLKRWFIDPITVLLISRYLMDFPEGDKTSKLNNKINSESKYNNVWSIVRSFLKSIGLATNQYPKTLSMLLELVAMAQLTLPGFIREYAKGKIDSVSVPEKVWFRVLTQKRLKINGKNTEPNANYELKSREFKQVNVRTYDQNKLYNEIIKLLYEPKGEKRKNKKEVIKNIRTYIDIHKFELAPITQCVAEWGLKILTSGTSTKSNLTIRSIYSYLISMKPILASFGAYDPLREERSSLEEKYRIAIDSKTTEKSSSYLVGRLNEFHHYFINCLRDPIAIDFLQLSSLAALTGSDVDANYITEEEYQLAVRYIGTLRDVTDRTNRARRLILVLGYRLGLRREEAWLLRLWHIVGKDAEELWVVEADNKRVKSVSGRRRIPIASLLTNEEQKWLLEWREERYQEEHCDYMQPSEALLFSKEGSSHMPIPENELFNSITTVIRTITGDESLVFHHNRHSQANQEILKSLSTDWSDVTLPDNMIRLGHDKRLLTRKHIYQASINLGHSSPRVTLTKYFHFCDVLLLKFLLSDIPEVAVTTLAYLAGTSYDNLRKFRERNSLNGGLLNTAVSFAKNRMPYAFEDFENKFNDLNPVSIDTPIISSMERVSEREKYILGEPSIRLLHQVISRYDDVVCNKEFWGKRLSYNEIDVERWKMSSIFLSEKRTSKSSPRYLRKNIDLLDENFERKYKYVLAFPNRKDDLKDMEMVVDGLRKLRLTDRKLANKGVIFYLNSKVSSHTSIYINSEYNAKKFLEFLVAIGIPKARIRLILSPQDKPSSKKISVQKSYWTNVLELSSSNVVIKEAIKRKNCDNGSIRLCVLSISNRASNRSSYGFGFAMYMTAILMISEYFKDLTESKIVDESH